MSSPSSAAEIEFGTEWQPLVDLRKKREHYALVAIGSNRVAIVGPSNFVDVWNIQTKAWKSYTLKKKRKRCAAVAIAERLYIFGGEGDFSCCEMLDLSVENVKSEPLPPMKEKKYDHSAVIYDDTKIVVLGGYSSRGATTSVAMFDTMANKWTQLPPMPTPRYSLAVGVAGHQVVVAGGRNGCSDLNTAELLDMRTKQWKSLSNLQERRVRVGGVVVGRYPGPHCMVVAGGIGLRSVEMYNFDSAQWSSLPNLKQSTDSWTRLVLLDGKLVAGGDRNLECLEINFPGGGLRLVSKLHQSTDFLSEFTALGTNLQHICDMPLVYTLAQLLYYRGAIDMHERGSIIRQCLDSCAALCVSVEHLAFFRVALSKAETDGIIDFRGRKFLDMKGVSVAHQKTVLTEEIQVYFDDAGKGVGKAPSLAIMNLQHSICAVHQCKEDFRAFLGALQENNESPVKHLRSGIAIVSAKLDDNNKKRVDTCMCALVALIQILSQSVGRRTSSEGAILTRIVDYGDIDHVRSAVGFDLSASFEEGVAAAMNQGDILNKELQHAEQKGDAMLLLGMFCKLVARESLAPSVVGDETDKQVNSSRSFGSTQRFSQTTKRLASGIQKGCPEPKLTRRSSKKSTERLASVTVPGYTGRQFDPVLAGDDHTIDLFAAIYHGRMEFLTEVFEYDTGVNVNQLDSMGRTPVDFAAIMGEPEMVDLLIQKGGQNKLLNRPSMRALALARADVRSEDSGKGHL